ncbi:hypothetical protein NC652_034947 [Populus alba x Populus x berolinensis]|nr:hypothetical protein NC652_034947 [Populus alba x Populus x berolinensis]
MSKNPSTPTTKFPIIDIKNEDHSGTTTKMTRSHWLKCCTISFRKKILAQEQSFFPVFTLPLQDGCKEITLNICYFIVIDHFNLSILYHFLRHLASSVIITGGIESIGNTFQPFHSTPFLSPSRQLVPQVNQPHLFFLVVINLHILGAKIDNGVLKEIKEQYIKTCDL